MESKMEVSEVNMDNAVILDTETHKLEGRAIEVAFFPLGLSSGKAVLQRNQSYNQRFNPLEPIDITAMAVHHILDQDVENQPAYTEFQLSADIEYIIGHNIDYDIRAIKRSGINQLLKPICTLALARRYFPQAPAHNLSVLSYYLAKDKCRVRYALKNAHSALTDIELTASLLNHLLAIIPKEFTTTMHALYMHSLDCRIPARITFGEHKGKKIDLIPDGYKQWLLKKADLDVYLCLALELDQASHSRRAFETNNGAIPGTFDDYQFIGSRTPVETNTKQSTFEYLLQKSLELH